MLTELMAHRRTLGVEQAVNRVWTSRANPSTIQQDAPADLSPPESMRWTSPRAQLALLRSGNSIWMELRLRTRIGDRDVSVAKYAERDFQKFGDLIQSFFDA